MLPFSRRHVRAVTHLHISREDAESAAHIIEKLHEKLASAVRV
jgi:hypothetical protein